MTKFTVVAHVAVTIYIVDYCEFCADVVVAAVAGSEVFSSILPYIDIVSMERTHLLHQ